MRWRRLAPVFFGALIVSTTAHADDVRDEMARANHAYLDAHEDGVAQATALLRRIRTLADRT